MLGSLCRYLRFMGYDTVSATVLREGNNREDTDLLHMASSDDRLLLTRDRELSARGSGFTVYIRSEILEDQLRQLGALNLISPEIRLTRCSLCNTLLTIASEDQIASSPVTGESETYYWCSTCKKLYWEGSHTAHLRNRLSMIFTGDPGR